MASSSRNSSSHFLQGKKIIVAGSGIAGLSFAAALRKQWDQSLRPPELVLYDRDPREVSQRREGYSLSLNGASKDEGLVALRDLGLLDQALRCAVPGSGPDSARSFRLWGAGWDDDSVLMTVRSRPYGGLPTAGIRIARRDLRELLIAAGEGAASRVEWGTTCTRAERMSNGRILVKLSREEEDGKITEMEDVCDLLVAADGAHSKIRAAVRPDDGLVYRGVVQMGGVASFPHGDLPRPLDESWGMAISGKGVGCFASPVSPTTIVWAVSRPETNPRPPLNADDAAAGQAIIDEARNIGSVLRGPFGILAAHTDPKTAIVIPARDKDPFMHDDVPEGIVFIGDANHAVSPFAGNGANLALKDGWDLAEQLCRGRSLRDAVAAYDKLAVGRARDTLKSSYQRMAVAHCKGVVYVLLRVGFWLGRWMFLATQKVREMMK